jgi:hypothetical protein
MTQQINFGIKHNKIFPILLLLGGTLILYVSVLLEISLNVIPGLVALFISFQMWTYHIIIITPSEIQTNPKLILGSFLPKRKYAYTPEQVSVRRNSVYINDKKYFRRGGLMLTSQS